MVWWFGGLVVWRFGGLVFEGGKLPEVPEGWSVLLKEKYCLVDYLQAQVLAEKS